jgi:hypothetical protein
VRAWVFILLIGVLTLTSRPRPLPTTGLGVVAAINGCNQAVAARDTEAACAFLSRRAKD